MRLAERYPISFMIVYLFLIEGMYSSCVSAGIEFAIAYGMYSTRKGHITLWAFPHTLSGDCALSLFIQVVITWYLEEFTVGFDDYKNRTCLLPFDKWFYEKYVKGNRFWYWYLEIDFGMLRHNKSASEKLTYGKYLKRQVINYPDRKFSFNFLEWAIRKLIRSILLAIPIFLVVWPVTMGIMAGTGTKIGSYDYYFNRYPYPQLMKFVFSFVVAFISTPLTIISIILRNNYYEVMLRSIKTNEEFQSLTLKHKDIEKLDPALISDDNDSSSSSATI